MRGAYSKKSLVHPYADPTSFQKRREYRVYALGNTRVSRIVRVYFVRHVLLFAQKSVQYVGNVCGVVRVAQLPEFPIKVVIQESAANAEQEYDCASCLNVLHNLREVVERLSRRHPLQIIVAAEEDDDDLRAVGVELTPPRKRARSGVAAHSQADNRLTNLLRKERDEIATRRGADARYQTIAEGDNVRPARRIVAHLADSKKIPVDAEPDEYGRKQSDDVLKVHAVLLIRSRSGGDPKGTSRRPIMRRCPESSSPAGRAAPSPKGLSTGLTR